MSIPSVKHGLIDSDYELLQNKFDGKRVIRLADVQDKIERVAFDVVRFRDSEGLDKLWVIQDQDGEQVLVATYEDDDTLEAHASASPWSALPDKSGNVSVFYKGDPITRIAMRTFGLPAEEAQTVCRFLPNKLASDDAWRSALFGELSSTEREDILTKYPELKG